MIMNFSPRIVTIVIGISIVLITFLSVLYMKNTAPVVKAAKQNEKKYFVTYTQGTKKNIRPKVTFYGKAMPRRILRFSSEIKGFVMQTMPQFFSGSYVKKGQVIIRLDQRDYQNQLQRHIITLEESEGTYKDYEAQIAQKESQLQIEKEQKVIAERDYQRAISLLKAGTISERSVETREKTFNNAKQTLNKSTNDLRILKIRLQQQKNRNEKVRVDIDNARRNIERTVIVAPFDGYIDDPNVEIGKQIREGDVIASLVDANNADVDFTISNTLYGSIIEAKEKIIKRQVDIFLQYGNQEIKFIGKIIAISPQVNAESGGINVKARVYKEDNANNQFRLLPGSFLRVEIPDRMYTEVLEIPESALYDGKIIYTINDNNRLTSHNVLVVGKNENNLLIKADTLTNLSKIVVTNFANASKNLLVEGKKK